LRVSIIAVLVLAVIVCGIYPAVVWGLAQVLFPHQANGSLIGRDGKPVSDESPAVGSELIGQNASDSRYFHPRPSSAGGGYDPTSSGGSNLGPTSAKLIDGTTKKDDKGNEVLDFDGVHDRIVHYCVENGIPFESSVPIKQFQDAQGNLDDVKLVKAFSADVPLVFTPGKAIPADAVTGSASGLDPQIGVDNAKLQAGRVAKARGVSTEKVLELVASNTIEPQLGLLGEAGVNVLKLNLALDRELAPSATQPAAK
jgi:K+-transporting ATPase ATPase C chain